MENAVLNAADMIISTTQPIAEELMQTHPDVNPDKFTVITNGFDSADYVNVRQQRYGKDHSKAWALKMQSLF